MRRFKLQTQITADGYMAGPKGELDWATVPFSDDMAAYIDSYTEPVDTIVLGRKLAEGFIPHWASGPEGEPKQYVEWINRTPKVVISNSLSESKWDNTLVAGGDLATTINELKASDGGDPIAFGGGTLVRSLIAEGLLDELFLFVNPTAIGAGMPVFPTDDGYQALRLADAKPFECGIAVMKFGLNGAYPAHSVAATASAAAVS